MENRVYIAQESEIGDIARALDSALRRRMLALLVGKELNIGSLAAELGIPQSTCTVNLQILERAKLVQTEQVAAVKGSQKICKVSCEEVVLPLMSRNSSENEKFIETEMPIGLYTDFRAAPPCGLVSSSSIIGYFDQVDSFLNPHRASAALIWFKSGFLEYRFPRNPHPSRKISGLSVTAELCSEFPGHKDEWPSDISVWINGIEIGTWTSPGDMGGVRGRHTPLWWGLRDTQYGFLKTWRVSTEGSFIDGVSCSPVHIADLDIEGNDCYKVRLGVKEDAENCGGINLFGNNFGNYQCGLILRVEFAD